MGGTLGGEEDLVRSARQRLRRLRQLLVIFGLTSLPVALGVALSLRSLAIGSDRLPMLISIPIAVLPVTTVINRLSTFRCPRCRNQFSKAKGIALHLTNEQCLHCRLDLVGAE